MTNHLGLRFYDLSNHAQWFLREMELGPKDDTKHLQNQTFYDKCEEHLTHIYMVDASIRASFTRELSDSSGLNENLKYLRYKLQRR